MTFALTVSVACLIILAIAYDRRLSALARRCDEQDRLLGAMTRAIDWNKSRTDALVYRTRSLRAHTLAPHEIGGTP